MPCANASEQSPPQLIPAGVLVTVPVPAPLRDTVSVLFVLPKVAVTDRAWSIVDDAGARARAGPAPAEEGRCRVRRVACSVTSVPFA